MRVHVPAHTPRSLYARAGRAKAARSATSASRPARAEEYTPQRRTAHPVWPLTLSDPLSVPLSISSRPDLTGPSRALLELVQLCSNTAVRIALETPELVSTPASPAAPPAALGQRIDLHRC